MARACSRQNVDGDSLVLDLRTEPDGRSRQYESRHAEDLKPTPRTVAQRPALEWLLSARSNNSLQFCAPFGSSGPWNVKLVAVLRCKKTGEKVKTIEMEELHVTRGFALMRARENRKRDSAQLVASELLSEVSDVEALGGRGRRASKLPRGKSSNTTRGKTTPPGTRTVKHEEAAGLLAAGGRLRDKPQGVVCVKSEPECESKFDGAGDGIWFGSPPDCPPKWHSVQPCHLNEEMESPAPLRSSPAASHLPSPLRRARDGGGGQGGGGGGGGEADRGGGYGGDGREGEGEGGGVSLATMTRSRMDFESCIDALWISNEATARDLLGRFLQLTQDAKREVERQDAKREVERQTEMESFFSDVPADMLSMDELLGLRRGVEPPLRTWTGVPLAQPPPAAPASAVPTSAAAME